MSKAPEPARTKQRWNTDVNPSHDAEQFVTVAAVNFLIRTFRRTRSRMSSRTR